MYFVFILMVLPLNFSLDIFYFNDSNKDPFSDFLVISFIIVLRGTGSDIQRPQIQLN